MYALVFVCNGSDSEKQDHFGFADICTESYSDPFEQLFEIGYWIEKVEHLRPNLIWVLKSRKKDIVTLLMPSLYKTS